MRRTTLILDEDLIAEARAALNAKTVTETIHLVLARVRETSPAKRFWISAQD